MRIVEILQAGCERMAIDPGPNGKRLVGVRFVNHRISSTLCTDMSGRMPPLLYPFGAGFESSTPRKS